MCLGMIKLPLFRAIVKPGDVVGCSVPSNQIITEAPIPSASLSLTDVASIQRLLGYLGKPTQAPGIARAAHGPPRWEEDFDPYEGTDLSEPLPEYEFDQRVSW